MPETLFFQDTPNGLEVALAQSTGKPASADMRSLYSKRRANRASPVLVIAFYGTEECERVSLCGPAGAQPRVYYGIEVSQAERLAQAALKEANHHAATRLLQRFLKELDSGTAFPGLRNVGLLARQELKVGVPKRNDWNAACARSTQLMELKGQQLIEGLGYQIEMIASNASLLKADGHKYAVAVFCDENETFEMPSNRFDAASPVSRALALADRDKVPWIILTRGSEIRLHSASPDVGVGRRGRSETFIECNLSLLAEQQAGYLHLLFSAEALADNGSFAQTLENSNDYASDMAIRLRDRVYKQTVPALAEAISKRISLRGGLTEQDLTDAYEQVMVILFRLLLVFYAEDNDLLPYRSDDNYRHHALSSIAQQLTEAKKKGVYKHSKGSNKLWNAVTRLWDAVNEGAPSMKVPSYNGGLFASDPEQNKSGAAIAQLSLTDAEFGPALEGVLLDEGHEGIGPVDLRLLTVREFGTIYEGLLESKLSVAQDDLIVTTVKGEARYEPAGPDVEDDQVDVPHGTVYLHHYSGARKATGSYFTKPFAVNHLLEHALEPALDAHIQHLNECLAEDRTSDAAQMFFDFRCADIAMGSGHFLVAAIDRIESRLSGWLALNPLPEISNELSRLRKKARYALRDLADDTMLEDCALLRRQIARHCVYGIDKNRVAVELARLSIWIHTFVPGLPLSFLDHNLLHGDCLTGVASLEDAVEALSPKTQKQGSSKPDTQSLFLHQLEELMKACQQDLVKLGTLNDADKAEIEEAREAHSSIHDKVAPAKAVFDVVTSVRAGVMSASEIIDFTPDSVAEKAVLPKVREAVQRFTPVHYPSDWPEVFARGKRSGFDCLLGNPPWDKVVVDHKVWWGMHLPGIRSMPTQQRQQKIRVFENSRPDLSEMFGSEKRRAEELKILLRATFPKLGSGQTDLYKAFSWANLGLCREGGHIGIVLPRTAMTDAGMASWRSEIITPPPANQSHENVSASGSHSHQQQRLGVQRDTPLVHTGSGNSQQTFSVATGINTKHWAFESVDGRYTIALVSVCKRSPRTEPGRHL